MNLTPSMIAANQRSRQKQIAKRKAARFDLSAGKPKMGVQPQNGEKVCHAPPNKAAKQNKTVYGRSEIQNLSKSKIKADLRTIFNAFIRMRDADDDGIIRCIDCGSPKHHTNCDAGHYLPTSIAPGLTFTEMNVNAQAKMCNFLEGNRLEYRKGMIKKYGLQKVELLEAMQNKKSGLGIFEFKILLLDYIQKFLEQCKRLNHEPNATQRAVLKRWKII